MDPSHYLREGGLSLFKGWWFVLHEPERTIWPQTLLRGYKTKPFGFKHKTNKLHFPRISTLDSGSSLSDVKLRPWKSSSPAALNLSTLLLSVKLTAGAVVF